MKKNTQTLTVYKTLRFLGVVSCVLLAGASAGTANAQAVESSKACAADFMTQMTNNAMLEAERRMLIASDQIRKPDSVLEYTCFDQRAALVAKDLGPIFSESNAWGSRTMDIGGGVGDNTLSATPQTNYSVNMGASHMDSIINSAVLSAVKNYVDSNFGHKYIGGLASSIDSDLKTSVLSVGTVCAFQDQVNKLSRCADFSADTAPFSNDFAWFASNDPRALPSTCSGTHKITTALIEQANNKGFVTTAIDQVNTYLDYIQARASGALCEVDEPIPTGVIVQYGEYSRDILNNNLNPPVEYEYEDKVCPNPSCYFDHMGNSVGSDDECKP